MLAPQEAWARIAPHTAPLPEESLPRRRALGRVLARPLAARVDVPGEDVSAMAGYALAGPVAPGDPPGFALLPPAVARIMTGAPVPAAADRVIPVEASDGGREAVTFSGAVGAGENKIGRA